jgi:hypothetical protein
MGCITVNTVNGTNTYSFVLGGVSSGVATRGRVTEFDDNTGYGQRQSGVLVQQTSSDFALDKLAANLAFGISGDDASVGRFAFGGSLTNSSSGSFSDVYGDSNDNGTVNSAMSGGSGGFGAAPDANGRTTASIAIGGITYNYVAYLVNTGEVLLLSSDPIATNPVASGTMLATAGSFSSSSLSGNYLVAATGADATNRGYSFAEIGILDFSAGDWNSTLYPYEGGDNAPSDDQGTAATATGTYTVGSASGRVSLAGGTGTLPVLYLTNGTTGTVAFVIDLDSGAGAPAYEGTLVAQPNETYSTSSLSGNYEIGMPGMPSNQDETYEGQATGSDGTVEFILDATDQGAPEIGGYTLDSTYSMNANGIGSSGFGTRTVLITNGTVIYALDVGADQADIIEFDQQ